MSEPDRDLDRGEFMRRLEHLRRLTSELAEARATLTDSVCYVVEQVARANAVHVPAGFPDDVFGLVWSLEDENVEVTCEDRVGDSHQLVAPVALLVEYETNYWTFQESLQKIKAARAAQEADRRKAIEETNRATKMAELVRLKKELGVE